MDRGNKKSYTKNMKKILFVCTGNICRSPSAEAVLKHLIRQNNCEDRFEIASAGTHGYHVGDPPDPRAVQQAARRGIDMTGIRAQKVKPSDFDVYDLIIAMDREHMRFLQEMKPFSSKASLRLFTDFMKSPASEDIPDPYYGDEKEFAAVLDMLEEGCAAMVRSLA